MSFRLFIYYSALSGAWGAFIAFLLVLLLGINGYSSALMKATAIGGVVGVVVALSVGALDAMLNATGVTRLVRVMLAGFIGLIGGMAGGCIGSVLAWFGIPFVVGWVITGMAIGASIGMYDLAQAMSAGKSSRGAIRKLTNGLLGGLVGGLLGGLPFGFLADTGFLSRTSLSTGLILLGGSVGLMIGLAQVAFREAWIKVEAGFRPGRELILSKEETVIGRGEGCDLGLFGDNKIEKVHARIRQEDGRYVLEDAGSTAGTYLNDEPINQEARVLKNGDVIGVGNCVIRFGTRQKQAAPAKRSRR